MKITKSQLKQIIKEELQGMLETDGEDILKEDEGKLNDDIHDNVKFLILER